METTEFLNRIIEVLRYVNSQTTTGEGKIQLTQEQFDQINQAQDVETMQSYLLAYNVPQYIVQWAADGTQSIDSLGEYDLSLGQAMSEFGSFQAGETIIGVPATYQSPRGEEATDYYTESDSEILTSVHALRIRIDYKYGSLLNICYVEILVNNGTFTESLDGWSLNITAGNPEGTSAGR